MICAVIVVPMFAPRMMEIACGRFISPALTKPIAITVVAVSYTHLCKSAVEYDTKRFISQNRNYAGRYKPN